MQRLNEFIPAIEQRPETEQMFSHERLCAMRGVAIAESVEKKAPLALMTDLSLIDAFEGKREFRNYTDNFHLTDLYLKSKGWVNLHRETAARCCEVVTYTIRHKDYGPLVICLQETRVIKEDGNYKTNEKMLFFFQLYGAQAADEFLAEEIKEISKRLELGDVDHVFTDESQPLMSNWAQWVSIDDSLKSSRYIWDILSTPKSGRADLVKSFIEDDVLFYFNVLENRLIAVSEKGLDHIKNVFKKLCPEYEIH